MFVKSDENNIDISDIGQINLGITLDCGQAFRWKQNPDLSWTGVVKNLEVTVKQNNDTLRFYNITEEEFTDILFPYFDFGRDYSKITETLKADRYLDEAISKYGTIRILRQDPWETLCSFIISSCNNIPRIKGIIEQLCKSFGNKISDTAFSFPSAEKIASLTPDDLETIRAGYRVPYILNAARMISDGNINLESLYNMNIEECEKELMKITGVGKKVADCTILFGLGHMDAFPIDRHIKRICENLYPKGLPECTKGIEGIAQQYMFHYQRTENL